MNNIRRKILSDVEEKLVLLSEILESILDEEDETRENMRNQTNYEASEEASNSIDYAISSLTDAIESIQEVTSI